MQLDWVKLYIWMDKVSTKRDDCLPTLLVFMVERIMSCHRLFISYSKTITRIDQYNGFCINKCITVYESVEIVNETIVNNKLRIQTTENRQLIIQQTWLWFSISFCYDDTSLWKTRPLWLIKVLLCVFVIIYSVSSNRKSNSVETKNWVSKQMRKNNNQMCLLMRIHNLEKPMIK